MARLVLEEDRARALQLAAEAVRGWEAQHREADAAAVEARTWLEQQSR